MREQTRSGTATVPPGGLRHRWPRTPCAAVALQHTLRSRVRTAGGPRRVRLVAGADLAYDPRLDVLYGAILVYRYPGLELVEARLVTRPIGFPYVPGLLSFRELPAILAAWRRLRCRPQLVLCDGQGIAHPRGVGLASHLGLLLGVPTIGCAKSRLVGEHGTVGPRRGDHAALRFGGRTVGAVLRTREGVRPVFVSPGHLIGLRAAVRFVLGCCRGFRIPEPIRRADHFVAEARRRGPRARRVQGPVLQSRSGTSPCAEPP